MKVCEYTIIPVDAATYQVTNGSHTMRGLWAAGVAGLVAVITAMDAVAGSR